MSAIILTTRRRASTLLYMAVNAAQGELDKLAAAAQFCTSERLSDVLNIAAHAPSSVVSCHLRMLVYALLYERKKVAELEEARRNKTVLESRGMP